MLHHAAPLRVPLNVRSPSGNLCAARHTRRARSVRLWLAQLMGRRPIKVAAVALTDKIARIAACKKVDRLIADQVWATSVTICCKRARSSLPAALSGRPSSVTTRFGTNTGGKRCRQ